MSSLTDPNLVRFNDLFTEAYNNLHAADNENILTEESYVKDFNETTNKITDLFYNYANNHSFEEMMLFIELAQARIKRRIDKLSVSQIKSTESVSCSEILLNGYDDGERKIIGVLQAIYSNSVKSAIAKQMVYDYKKTQIEYSDADELFDERVQQLQKIGMFISDVESIRRETLFSRLYSSTPLRVPRELLSIIADFAFEPMEAAHKPAV